MLSAFYICGIYSIALIDLRLDSIMKENTMYPVLTAPGLGPYCLQYRLP